MANINCVNENKKKRLDLSKIKKNAGLTLKELKKGGGGVNIVFVSNQKIRAMNRKYLRMDSSTDVLAFRQDDGKAGFGAEKDLLGDIIISSDKAAQNAVEYGVSFEEEIALYVIHGILHLAGYEDRTKKGEKRMRRAQDGLLKKVKS